MKVDRKLSREIIKTVILEFPAPSLTLSHTVTISQKQQERRQNHQGGRGEGNRDYCRIIPLLTYVVLSVHVWYRPMTDHSFNITQFRSHLLP